jgi:ATP-dependent Clp protease ATP-binding subunit ClpA
MHRFDPQARLVFHYAAEEARRLGHSRIAPEHLLLGALRLEHGAVHALNQMGLGLGVARQKLEDKVGRREPIPASQIPDISQAATDCMESAAAEARRLQAQQIGVGHVLLGIIRTAELSTRQLTGGLTVAQMLGELEGGVRGVLRRVLESLRQPNPSYVGLHLEPSAEAGQLEPITIALQLEPDLHLKLLKEAQVTGVSVEVLLKTWIEHRLKGL